MSIGRFQSDRFQADRFQVAATGGTPITQEVIISDISVAFATEFDGAKLSPAQRRKLDEYKKGVWLQLGRKHTTRTYARWYARQEARRLRRRMAA